MKGISQFFDKYKNSAVREIQKRVIICEILQKEMGQEIPIEDILFSNGIIKVKGNSVMKSQLFIKKINIISQLKKRLPNLKILDIK